MLAASIPHREICEQLHMGRGVLAKYKKAADERHLSYADGGRMNEVGEIGVFPPSLGRRNPFGDLSGGSD